MLAELISFSTARIDSSVPIVFKACFHFFCIKRTSLILSKSLIFNKFWPNDPEYTLCSSLVLKVIVFFSIKYSDLSFFFFFLLKIGISSISITHPFLG
jgi:hypothetical protein